MKIEHIKVKNFKCLRNIEINDIPNYCVIVGANGSGKSTLFNVFSFLQEALSSNVHYALIKQGGSKGFSEVISRGVLNDENIEIKLKYRAKKTTKKNPLITYTLKIGLEDGEAIVTQEVLKYRRGPHGKPWEFLNFQSGEGTAVTNEILEDIKEEKDLTREAQTLKAKNILAIKGLAQFKKFPAVVALGNLIEHWHLSDIHISKARNEQQAGLSEHLSHEGENLSLVIDYLHKKHPDKLDEIIDALKHRIPGIKNVRTRIIETGQILLQIQDRSFEDPFLVRYVSDGTIKMLAYLVLLYDPNPHPLLCVEEPENQLYPNILEELAEEFRKYADSGSQVFVSTHSPEFINAAQLDEVFWLVKKDGYTSVRRALDDKQLEAYMNEGEKLGSLWKQGCFEDADPKSNRE